MRRICLSIPTNRACAPAIASLAQEAAYAVRRFGVEVYVAILDTSDGDAFAENARAVREIPRGNHIIALHLSEAEQRRYLREAIECAGLANPGVILNLMLPNAVSYGACTNRMFLVASALRCHSVHRRDSDSRYQSLNGASVFPIHHELLSIGKPAAEAKQAVSQVALNPIHEHKPVSLVGASFIGEMSVDVAEMMQLDRDAYYELASLWASSDRPEIEKRRLAQMSFRGAGTARFTEDRSTLALVNPMLLDMCNISFYRVHEQIPLPPATDTIGSDYFLFHAVRNAKLPGVVHNRHIENFYTPERRTDAGFIAYHRCIAKFFLSMLYFHFIYKQMARAGSALLDGDHLLSAPKIAQIVRDSADLERHENEQRLDVLDRVYRAFGGRYAKVADLLAEQRQRLLDDAEQDVRDFALLIDSWAALIKAAKTLGLHGALRRAG